MPQSSQAVLEAVKLSRSFGAHRAVDQVSIQFEKERLHCILGPNGAGKTTLFNLLTKDLAPSEGQILLHGRDVTGSQPHRIARMGVGRSYQISSVYLNMTVRENVWVAAYRALYGGKLVFWRNASRYQEAIDVADQLLQRFDLLRFADEKTNAISYGDQRLLEIAVTLATKPSVLLLDEPTAGLSQRETDRVKHAIRDLKSAFTIVMIEHKMNFVMEISDVISVMDRGAVIAQGTPDEIRSNEAVQRAYFGM